MSKKKKPALKNNDSNKYTEAELREAERVRAEAQYLYNEKKSREAVGKLFSSYADESFVAGYDDDASFDEATSFEDSDSYSDEQEIMPIKHKHDTENNIEGELPKESPVDAMASADKGYSDYISSMARISIGETQRHLEQPESIKQYTMRQDLIQKRKELAEKNYRLRTDSLHIESVEEYDVDEYDTDGYDTDDYDSEEEYYSSRRYNLENSSSNFLGNFRTIIVCGGFIVLIVFSFMVFKINTVSAQLKEATEKLVAAAEKEEEYESLKIEYEGLEATLAETELKVGLLSDGISILDPNNVDEDSIAADDPETNSLAETGSESSTTNNTVTTPTTNSSASKYIVKDGDTFWSIAEKTYGNGVKSKDIMDANNLTEEAVLKIGSELILP